MGGSDEEAITSLERLREIYPQPGHRAERKVIDHLDDICRRFIAAAPFAVLATRGADGLLDLSPRGDPAGFVAVLDDHTLVLPDRRGNNRLDTLENLLSHPEIGLIFVVPGSGHTLRVSGRARIVRDAALQRRFAMDGKEPATLIVVDVRQAFMQCPKCMVRSKLWQSESWPDPARVPTMAEALVAHASLAETVQEVEAVIEEGNARRLY